MRGPRRRLEPLPRGRQADPQRGVSPGPREALEVLPDRSQVGHLGGAIQRRPQWPRHLWRLLEPSQPALTDARSLTHSTEADKLPTAMAGRDPRKAADSKFDLVVLGDCNPDLVLTGDEIDPSFGQVERLVDDADLMIGGSGGILACGAARLGLRTAFVGMVGDDVFG